MGNPMGLQYTLKGGQPKIRPKKQRHSAALSVVKIRQKLCKMGYLLIKWDGFAC